MTIFELQKHLQEAYEKYGDIEVMLEDTDWTGIEKYRYDLNKVNVCDYGKDKVVTISNS